MNTGAFGEGFPYTNFHDLNMDWIIKIAKDFLDQYTHIQEIIEQGKTDIQELTDSGLEQLQEKTDALEALLQQWYDTHSEDIADELANALSDLNDWYNEHSQDISEQLTEAILHFNTSAQTIGAEVIESIPDDYTELSVKANDTKDMLEQVTGLILPTWENNKSYTTSGSTLPSATDNPLCDACIIPCSAGDKFILFGTGGDGARLWAFADSSDNIIAKSNANTSRTDGIPIIAPTDSAKLIVNILHSSTYKILYKYADKNFAIRYAGFLNGNIEQIRFQLSSIKDASYRVITEAQLISDLPSFEVSMNCILLSFPFGSEMNSMLHIAMYQQGQPFIKIGSGNWISFTDMLEYTHGLFTNQFNNANTWKKPGYIFIPASITSDTCSNLPKYGVSAVLKNSVNIRFSGNIAYIQSVQYVDGDEYSRLIYGYEEGVQTQTPWRKYVHSPVITVSQNGYGDYTDLATACANAHTGDTIMVYPGTYEGTIDLYGKEISIIGTDKRKCIIQNNIGTYDNPVLKTTKGYYENLTFRCKYVSGTSEAIGADDLGAYAIHCESAEDSSGTGKTLTFRNCIMESDFFPAIGIGTSVDWTLELDSCELITNQPSGRGKYTSDGGLGAMYLHDKSTSPYGNAYIIIRNCIFRNTILANAMCIYDLGLLANHVTIQAINNTIASATEGMNNPIWWRGVTTPFANAYSKSPINNGNTATVLNN